MRTPAAMLVLCLLALPVCARYSGGSGTADDPYQIATADDLITLGERPDDYDKHFILTADIDLDPNLPGRKVFERAVIAPVVVDPNRTGRGLIDLIVVDPEPNWVESWSPGDSFTGVVDGNDHTIWRLTIVGDTHLGLFGKLGAEAEIFSLGLEAVDVNGTWDYVGGLAGLNNGSVTASYCTGSIRGDDYVGGLVGFHGGNVMGSYSAASVRGREEVGGLVGWNCCGDVNECSSTGEVVGDRLTGSLVGNNDRGAVVASRGSGKVTGQQSVGGLVGGNRGGSIEASHSTATVEGGRYAGGLAGYNSAHGRIAHSHSTGTVGGGEEVGGLLGVNNSGADIVQSYSTATVTGTSQVGGLIGSNAGSAENCYAVSLVSGHQIVGGLVGQNGRVGPWEIPHGVVYLCGRLFNCHSAGSVTDADSVGGLVGRNLCADIHSCFWDAETSGLLNMCGSRYSRARGCDDSYGLTTAEMQTTRPFLDAGWDFVCETTNGTEDIWYMPEGDYPRLVWELEEVPACPAVVIEVDATNFSETVADGVVLVGFYATWCPHCRTQAPILDDVAEQVQGQAVVAKLDIDESPSVAQQYNVSAIPTMIVFKNGRVFDRFLGVTQAPKLVAAVQAAVDHRDPMRR